MTVIDEKRYHFTVESFYNMYEAGIFKQDERVELIEGEIIQMTPVGSWHSAVVDRLNDLFVERFKAFAIVRIQGPVILSNISEPLPDVVVMKRREDYYESGHPNPEDVLLIVEVSDSTLRFDKEIKVPLYARSGIAEVWIVNLNEDCIEVYREPSLSGYNKNIVFKRGQKIAPEFYGDKFFLTDDILG